ncbi:MAG TPA: hypothetical protein VE715_04055, partial [Blastocatellia bacterium]|nr:hypothetical protein [Blastocatellia bacterium]
ILGSTNFRGRRTQGGYLSNHCRRIEVNYQSGSKQPHSKDSADLCTGFNLSKTPKNTPSIAEGLDGDEFGIVGASPTIDSIYKTRQSDVT